MTPDTTTVTLNNGVVMPLVGFGVYQLTDPSECERCVIQAIEAGYRLIDTAALYLNEAAVGQGIRHCALARDKLFITSKLWVQDVGYERTQQAINQSLQRLGLDYLDLYLIHQPYGDVHGAWRAMQEAHQQGKLRAIGVSNFYADRLLDLKLFNEIAPAVNQIEVNPFLQQTESVPLMHAQGTKVQAWAPFAQGRQQLFEHPELAAIGAQYDKSVAQVILRWLLQRGIASLAKTANQARMIENVALFDFALTAADMARIAALDKNTSSFFSHRDLAIVKWMNQHRLQH